MNYIKEINSFYDWLETNSVSDSAITLWHALMHINNKTGWKVEFAVASSVLCLKSGLSNSSFKRARNILKQSGRIEWRERKGNQSAIYSLNQFAVQYDPQTVPQSEPQSDPQTVPQSEPITKLNKTKLNFLLEKETKETEVLISENEPDKIQEEITSKKVAPKKVSFQPPDPQEVQNYCDERRNGLNGQEFCDFYESKGWLIGKNKMKSWEAAVRTWEKYRKNGNTNNTGTNPRKISTYQYAAQKLSEQSARNSESGNYTIDAEIIECEKS